MVKDLLNEIYAYALENAILHEKAIPGAVLPKLFQHGLNKDEIKDIMPLINQVVSKVNKWYPTTPNFLLISDTLLKFGLI